jgi:hypothetical protein
MKYMLLTLMAFILGTSSHGYAAVDQNARYAGEVSISPSLVAFKEDIVDDPLSPDAPVRDADGNFLVQFAVVDVDTRIWTNGTASLYVLQNGSWVLLDTVTITQTRPRQTTLLFDPVSFTPELGDLTYSQWWPNGRMEFQVVMEMTDRRGEFYTLTREAPVYRCMEWRWGGCVQ